MREIVYRWNSVTMGVLSLNTDSTVSAKKE